MKYDENSNKDLARITHNVRNNTQVGVQPKNPKTKRKGVRNAK